MCFWHNKPKLAVTFFFPSPSRILLVVANSACCSMGTGRGGEVTRGVGCCRCPCWAAPTRHGGKSSLPLGDRSGKPGDSVDDVGQGGPGLRGREALQGCQRSAAVAPAEVDCRSHTFASLDRLLQLSENTGTTGWVSATLAYTIITRNTEPPPPLPEVKARTKAVMQSSEMLSAAPFCLLTTTELQVI